jgi:hypothetical protein
MAKATKKRVAAKPCNEACARAYRENAAEVHKLLARLTKAAEQNFDATFGGVDGDRIHFGHVGSLGAVKVALREISDQVFREGEHAQS